MARKILALLLAVALFSLGAFPVLAERPWKTAPDGRQNATVSEPLYRGNVSSNIFHRKGCRYFRCKHCLQKFATREAAMGAGFRPCKVCNP